MGLLSWISEKAMDVLDWVEDRVNNVFDFTRETIIHGYKYVASSNTKARCYFVKRCGTLERRRIFY